MIGQNVRASIPTSARNALSKTAAASLSKNFRTLNDFRQSHMRKRYFLVSNSEGCTRGLFRPSPASGEIGWTIPVVISPGRSASWSTTTAASCTSRETNLFGCVRYRNGDHDKCCEDPINRCSRGKLVARNATPSAYRSTVISGGSKPTYRIE